MILSYPIIVSIICIISKININEYYEIRNFFGIQARKRGQEEKRTG